MRLTKLGDTVLGLTVFVLFWATLAGAAIIGQELKQDRLDRQQGTIDPVSINR